MNDDGARFLVGAILRQAHEDYIAGNCVSWCPVYETCTTKDNMADQRSCDAKLFLHSKWCETLSEGIDINYEKYVELTIKKARISQSVFKYVESELRGYKNSIVELEHLKRNIIEAAPIVDNSGGTNNAVGNPTESKALKLISNKKLQRLESVISVIRSVFDACDKSRQELIRMKYWNNIYKDEGIADRLGIDRSTLYRWKNEIVLKVALKMGYL